MRTRSREYAGAACVVKVNRTVAGRVPEAAVLEGGPGRASRRGGLRVRNEGIWTLYQQVSLWRQELQGLYLQVWIRKPNKAVEDSGVQLYVGNLPAER